MLRKSYLNEAAILIAVIVLLLIFNITYGNWNLSLMFNEKTVDLEGEMTTSDGYLTLEPRELILDHSKVTLLVDYQVDDKLRELGFQFSDTTTPRLLLAKESDVDRENSTLRMAKGTHPDSSEKITEDDEEYFKYEYWYQDFPYELEENLTISIDKAYMSKSHQEEFSVEPGDSVEVEIPGIGKYQGELGEPEKNLDDLDTITFKGETTSEHFDYGFEVRDYLKSVIEDQEITPKQIGGSRSSGRDSSHQTIERTYRVEDSQFWEGELLFSIGRVRIPLGNRFEAPYMDINVTGKK
ncbi:hypothetical protein [Natranaerobius thermophilus]|uniref:DUF4179 domain-containing protein n=1 Tax=Natranaerobius thermophilus (strain ATCC BAA-1301 / DSM 18059 / JW/NM-WN-LF) TaxID=457570 RepID=B2A4U1_NATTJ|nr:hypothetical protein [Natranaerobius thermophilus]ACB83863.1 hypothetical protein Nther_0265 [Natranaerobius thermophilus JW/NM-WN-LF]